MGGRPGLRDAFSERHRSSDVCSLTAKRMTQAPCVGRAFVVGMVTLTASAVLQSQTSVPTTWDDDALREWATPVAGLNLRPAHFPEAEYYKAPVDNLRTYPVYYPGREPAGYWEMLQAVGPKPLIEPATLSTAEDWIQAGKRVFEEYDTPAYRVFDPSLVATARYTETFAGRRVSLRADGTLPDMRWVPTERGVALGFPNCAGCHVRRLPDGTLVNGAPPNESGSGTGRFGIGRWGASAIALTGDTPLLSIWRSWAVPWIQDDVHDGLKTMPPGQAFGLIANAVVRPGIFPRWNGSGYYPTKIPDLIGLKDRQYIDHTATHRHRSPADFMRYAALVTYSDISDFGPHRMLTDEQRRIPYRLPDEALYAMALYVYSLQAPPNPNLSDARIPDGERVFRREGCAGCHTPPLYTNNKVTLAQGFVPPSEHAQFMDILPVSVGTDPGLALKTRKGTGYYKVPSLKGAWYRGHYLHDGSLTSLEEMFDPARLTESFVPSGFLLPAEKSRAIRGHEFGLKLDEAERGALIAFLRSL